jgi:hypothetical protein
MDTYFIIGVEIELESNEKKAINLMQSLFNALINSSYRMSHDSSLEQLSNMILKVRFESQELTHHDAKTQMSQLIKKV